MKTQEIKTEYDGLEVIYKHWSQNWTLNGTSQDIVETLAPDKFKAVNDLIADEIKKIEAQEKIEEEEKNKLELQKLENWRREVETYKSLYDNPYNIKWDVNANNKIEFHIDLYGCRKWVTINFDDEIYNERGFGRRKVANPWVLRYDWKCIRYGKLETALKKASERMNDDIDWAKEKMEMKKKEKNEFDTAKEALAKDGIELYKHETYTRDHKGNAVPVNKTICKVGKVRANTTIDNGKIILEDVRITTVLFTPAQLKKISEFIDNLQ